MRNDELEAFCNGVHPGMPAWQIAMIAVNGALAYFVFAGITQRWWKRDATVYNDGPVGLLWPVLFPWLLGLAIADFAIRPRIPRATAKERRP